MEELTTANNGIKYKRKALLPTLILYAAFTVISAWSFYRELNMTADDTLAMFGGYFKIIWIIGFLFCMNGALRGFSRLYKKQNALDADEIGLVVRSYPDYPPLVVRWSNIKRAIRIDDSAFIEIRDADQLLEKQGPVNSMLLKYGGFITGSKLIRNDYTGVKNGPCAVAIKSHMLDATADEIVLFVKKNLEKYKNIG